MQIIKRRFWWSRGSWYSMVETITGDIWFKTLDYRNGHPIIWEQVRTPVDIWVNADVRPALRNDKAFQQVNKYAWMLIDPLSIRKDRSFSYVNIPNERQVPDMPTVEAKLDPIVQTAMDAVAPVLVDVSEVQKYQKTVKFILADGRTLKIQIKAPKAE